MQYLVPLLDSFVGLLDALEIFFFSPINEVISKASTLILFGDSALGQIFNSVFRWLSGKTLGAIGDLTVFQVIFGGGLIVFLLYKLILFIVPVAD